MDRLKARPDTAESPAMPKILTVLVASVCLLGLASPARAVTTEMEPNDSLFQANGPVAADGIEGTVNTAGDPDLFALRLRPQRQIKVSFDFRGVCTSGSGYSFNTPRVSIQARRGSNTLLEVQATTDSGSDRYRLVPASGLITTPGTAGGETQDFVLTVDPRRTDPGCLYKVAITAPDGGATDAVDPTPPPSYPTVFLAEPNDLPTQASGPLSGEISYSGTIETANDVDTLAIPVKAGLPAIVVAAVSKGSLQASFDQRDAISGSLDATAPAETAVSIAVSKTHKTHLLKLTGDVGTEYRIVITPAGSIGPPGEAKSPAVQPSLAFVKRSVTIRRQGQFYRGRVKTKTRACASEVVVLIKSRTRVVKRVRTRKDGTWTIRLKRTKHVRAVVQNVARSGKYACGAGTSRTLRAGG